MSTYNIKELALLVLWTIIPIYLTIIGWVGLRKLSRLMSQLSFIAPQDAQIMFWVFGLVIFLFVFIPVIVFIWIIWGVITVAIADL